MPPQSFEHYRHTGSFALALLSCRNHPSTGTVTDSPPPQGLCSPLPEHSGACFPPPHPWLPPSSLTTPLPLLSSLTTNCQLQSSVHFLLTASFYIVSSIKIGSVCFVQVQHLMDFPGGSDGKESTCNAGDPGSIPGLGRSPAGRHGNSFRYSCLENPHSQRSLAAPSTGSQRVRLDQVTNTFTFLLSHFCSFYFILEESWWLSR